MIDYPREAELPSNIRIGPGIQECRVPGPSYYAEETFSRKDPWACQEHTNHLPYERSQGGKDQDNGIIKATIVIRYGCSSRPEIMLGLNPELVGTLGVLHDTVFREHLMQRPVHSIQLQDDGVAKVRTCRNSHV